MLPIRVGLDPMEKLLVANFDGDPEFDAIEPQTFDDPVNGTGMRVLRYRKDGTVDAYWQPGVRVDRSTFTVGAGIADFAEVAIEPARFEVTAQGVDVDVAFTDAQGRKVELRIRDAAGERGFPLLAPVGADIEQPLQLFLVYMPDIRLVRRAGSIAEGRIGERALRPSAFPFSRRWRLMRYVAGPVIGSLNPPANEPLVVELPARGTAEVDGMSVVVDADGNIAAISAGREPRSVDVDFAPGYPNLLGLPDGGSASGRWSIRIAGVRITGGSYGVAREGSRVRTELDVTERWKPSGLPLSMELFTRVVRMFRTWPTTYRWRGTVELGSAPAMSGSWERTGRRRPSA